MNCRLCGKPLSRIRLRREGEFCSPEHRERYQFQRGMSLLMEADKVAVLARRREDPVAIPLQRPAFPGELKGRRWSRPAGSLFHGGPCLPEARISSGPAPRPAMAGMLAPGGWQPLTSGAAAPAYRAPARKSSARRLPAIPDGPALRRPQHAGWQGMCGPLDGPDRGAQDRPAERRGAAGRTAGAAALQACALKVTDWLEAAEQRLARVAHACRIEERGCAESPGPRQGFASARLAVERLRFQPGPPAFNGLAKGRRPRTSAAPAPAERPRRLAPPAGRHNGPGRPIECRREPHPRALICPSAKVIRASMAGTGHAAPHALKLRPSNGIGGDPRAAQAPFAYDHLLLRRLRCAVQGTFAGTVEEAASASRLEEHFSSGLSRWVGGTADWRVDAAGVRIGGLALLGPSVALGDYDLEFLAKVGGHRLGWVFRAADLNNYYGLAVTVEGSAVQLVRWAVVAGVEEPAVAVPVSAGLRRTAAFRVVTTVRGTEFSVAVEGETIARWSDARLAAGGVGFAALPEDRARLYWVRLSSYD